MHFLTKNNLTEKEYKRIINEAFELGVKNVMFTGRGEPLFYPVLWQLLKYVKNNSPLYVWKQIVIIWSKSFQKRLCVLLYCNKNFQICKFDKKIIEFKLNTCI